MRLDAVATHFAVSAAGQRLTRQALPHPSPVVVRPLCVRCAPCAPLSSSCRLAAPPRLPRHLLGVRGGQQVRLDAVATHVASRVAVSAAGQRLTRQALPHPFQHFLPSVTPSSTPDPLLSKESVAPSVTSVLHTVCVPFALSGQT